MEPVEGFGLRQWLGKKVKCRFTGFSGRVMAFAVHITGCDRLSVQPPTDKDGKLPDSYWFDVTQLDVVEDEPKVEAKQGEKPGGPPSRFR